MKRFASRFSMTALLLAVLVGTTMLLVTSLGQTAPGAQGELGAGVTLAGLAIANGIYRLLRTAPRS